MNLPSFVIPTRKFNDAFYAKQAEMEAAATLKAVQNWCRQWSWNTDYLHYRYPRPSNKETRAALVARLVGLHAFLGPRWKNAGAWCQALKVTPNPVTERQVLDAQPLGFDPRTDEQKTAGYWATKFEIKRRLHSKTGA